LRATSSSRIRIPVNYYGNKAVGDFLWDILRVGKTEDWRKLLHEATGEEISARPMLDYSAPLVTWLQKENQGRELGW
jgi:peptidyl-dipeptidase A